MNKTSLGEILVKYFNDRMWLKKYYCSICHNKFSKSKIKEYETIEQRKILCCDRCSNYLKKVKKNRG